MDFKYPYTDYHELNLDWFLNEFKNLVDIWARTQQDWISMQEYIRDYFTNLNVQTEIDNKINAMILDGTFGAIVEPFVTAALPAMVAGQLPDVVAAQIGSVVAAQIGAVVAGQLPAIAAQAAADEVGTWLAAHIDPDTGYVIDKSLTVSDAAADAKTVGDEFAGVIEDFTAISPDMYINPGTITDGGYISTTGEVTPSTGAAYSDFISVNEFETLRFRNVYVQGSRAIVAYKDNQSAISAIAYNTTDTDIVATMPANTKYIRLTVRTGNTPEIIRQNVIANSIKSKVDIDEFKIDGLYHEINNWQNGYIRGANFPKWSSSSTIMTTAIPFHVEIGFRLLLKTGYSMIVIKSDGTATRYNSHYTFTYSDNVWVEVNKTDDTTILPSERPVTFCIAWKESIAYVDGVNGNDFNDGSSSYPYKTIMAAVNSGRGNIYVKSGTYSEMVDLRYKTYPISIQLWSMPTYDVAYDEAPKIIIDGGAGNSILYGIVATGCDKLFLSDIHCKRSSNALFQIKNTQYVECVRCIASDSLSNKMGFEIYNVNGRFIDCVAHDIGADGFNIHGYGDTEFINCIAYDCGDDGISHHDGCTGHISGGEYYRCSKGGVASPTYGAYVDVNGVYCHNNSYGIYAVSTDNTRRKSHMRISNSVLKNNTIKDILISRTDGTGWNLLYDTINIDSDSSFTVI